MTGSTFIARATLGNVRGRGPTGRLGGVAQATAGKVLPVILAFLLALSCNRTEPVAFQEGRESGNKYPVALSISGAGDDISIAESRTTIGNDGKSVYWADDDHIALWAVNPADALELNAVPFRIFGVSDNRAIFTAELDAPMNAPSYTYCAASPLPETSQWPYASFTIPEIQDGTGQGIMIADPVEGMALRSIDESPESGLVRLAMEQQLHLLKFWLSDPSDLLGGEAVQRINLFFPQKVTGNYTKNLTEPEEAGSLENGSYYLTMELATPLPETGAGERKYALATVFPRKWGNTSEISGKLYTETKVARLTNIPLQGRDMAAGHTTAVRMIPGFLINRCKVYIRLNSNPLGEDIESITLTAPSGCKWGDNLENIYTWYTGESIAEGAELVFDYEDENAFRTLSGKSISVTFDSEHVRTAQTVNIPNLSGQVSTTLNLNVPPLLQENFDSVGSFSSYDEFDSGSIAFSKDAYSFLNGWSGGRIGASAGKCIRIACRRETSANYHARVDSAPLTGTLKKSANLKVEFSYGSNNDYTTIKIFNFVIDGNVGQDCYVGYVTSSKEYKSGDEDGFFDRTNNTFYAKEYSGSWTNTPNDTYYILNGVPAISPIRISWRTEIEKNTNGTFTTAWLYLDNIKVTIAK